MATIKANGHLTLDELHDSIPGIMQSAIGRKSFSALYGTYDGATAFGAYTGSPEEHLSFDDFYGKTLEYHSHSSGLSAYGGFNSTVTGNVSTLTPYYIPVDTSKVHTLELLARSVGSISSVIYPLVACYDEQFTYIAHWDSHHYVESRTTLAQTLNPGDTVAHLTDASGWQLSTNWFNNTLTVSLASDPWAPYTRMKYKTNFIALDVANNTITIGDVVDSNQATPFEGAPIPAGTPVAQGFSGGSYLYPMNTLTVPNVLTPYTGNVSGMIVNGTPNQFRPGTAYVRIGFLANYWQTSEASVNIQKLKFFEVP